MSDKQTTRIVPTGRWFISVAQVTFDVAEFEEGLMRKGVAWLEEQCSVDTYPVLYLAVRDRDDDEDIMLAAVPDRRLLPVNATTTLDPMDGIAGIHMTYMWCYDGDMTGIPYVGDDGSFEDGNLRRWATSKAKRFGHEALRKMKQAQAEAVANA